MIVSLILAALLIAAAIVVIVINARAGRELYDPVNSAGPPPSEDPIPRTVPLPGSGGFIDVPVKPRHPTPHEELIVDLQRQINVLTDVGRVSFLAQFNELDREYSLLYTRYSKVHQELFDAQGSIRSLTRMNAVLEKQVAELEEIVV